MPPSTPSPSTTVHTPPAPRLGFHDDWEPFSPRKSSRLSAQRNAARTPSPNPTVRQPKPPASPRTTKKALDSVAVGAVTQNSAAMASPALEPRKKRQTTLDSLRRVAPALAASSSSASASASASASEASPAPASAPKDDDTTANDNDGASKEESDSMTTKKPALKSQAAQAAQASRSAAMLPTPSKTPQKPPCEKAAATLKSLARNLFPSSDEGAIASPRKKRLSKLSAMGLDTLAGDEAEEYIHIFTDSQDRIPNKDQGESNPFFNAQQEAPRRSKRRQILIPGEGYQSIEEASRREDGMIYVFRGKKFFRKFAEARDEEHQDSELDADTQVGRALTRSSIKPRLLFPVKKTEKTKEMLEEEETTTDVDEAHAHPPAEKTKPKQTAPQTPTKTEPERAETPEAPKFAPVSPPDTKRVTRSTNKLVDALTPMKLAKKKSPFDSWRRTKESSATPSATKRQGEPLASTTMKRTRA